MSKARDLGDAANKANFLDNVTSDIQAQLNSNTTAAANAVLPAGLILPFGGTSAPTGYLECNGNMVSRTTYASLFAAIGTTWGAGNGNTTFNLPDLRGTFLRGTGSNATHNMANGSDFAGPSVGGFENDQFQGHGHTIGTYAGTATYGVSRRADNGPTYSTISNAIGDPTQTSAGAPRYGDETRPFNAGILYCIKT
jgi:microcystin-dependent protein